MKKMKRALALTAAAALTVSCFAGCGKKNVSTDGVKEVSAFFYFVPNAYSEDMPIWKEAEKKTGIRIKSVVSSINSDGAAAYSTMLAGDKEFDFENNFSDVSADDWFADVVNAAYKEGLVSGDGNGSFKPNDLISRQDMAIIIYNAAKKFNLFDTEKTGSDFSDDASISDYAKDAVYTLKSKGIIKGMEDGTFRPLENADRASAAQMIYSLIAKYNG